MATVTTSSGAETDRLATAHRSTTTASWTAYRALLLRDLTVLRKTLNEFLPRTLLQPFLLVFVFTFVFPKIGQGVGGAGNGGPAAAAFATLLVAGVVGVTILFQGIQSVALPIAAVVPANPVHLHVNWPVLLTLAPLACITASALGLTFGTRFEPRTVPLMFGVVVIPLTFLGCVYYSWTALGPIKVGGFSWLKFLVLINPLVYMCEGFRAALTTAPHMSLAVVYLVLAGFAALFLYLGINGFKKRVLS